MLVPSLQVFQLQSAGGVDHVSTEVPSHVAAECRSVLKALEGHEETDPELDILYKQWFDNVEEYLTRKRQREDEKKQRKKQRTAGSVC